MGPTISVTGGTTAAAAREKQREMDGVSETSSVHLLTLKSEAQIILHATLHCIGLF